MTQIRFAGERFPAVDGASREVVLYRAIGPAPASEEERQPKSMHPGYVPDGNVIRLVQVGDEFREVDDTDRLGGTYVAIVLESPEPCACDGNLMPVGHLAYADCEHGHAVSAEHCEVIAEDVRVHVERGQAYVSAATPIVPSGRAFAGIWHLGDLVDNHVSGSEPWTRSLAADALIQARADAIDSSYVGEEDDPAVEDASEPQWLWLVDDAIVVAGFVAKVAIGWVAFHPTLSPSGSVTLNGTLTFPAFTAVMGVILAVRLARNLAREVAAQIAGSAWRWSK